MHLGGKQENPARPTPVNKGGGGSQAGSGGHRAPVPWEAPVRIQDPSVLDLALPALTPICFHLAVSRAKSHSGVTSSLLPEPVPRAEDARVCQESDSEISCGQAGLSTQQPDWSRRKLPGAQRAAGSVRVRGCLGFLSCQSKLSPSGQPQGAEHTAPSGLVWEQSPGRSLLTQRADACYFKPYCYLIKAAVCCPPKTDKLGVNSTKSTTNTKNM